MLYVQLDANWPDNPKIIRAGWEAAGVHAAVMCLAKRLEKDGWVDRTILRRMDATDAVLDRLVELGLLEAEDDSVRPHDWLDRNPSQAAIDARRASKIDAGKRGNHAKWDHPAPYETCTKCHPELLVIAECDPTGLATHRTPTKSESKSEVTIATPPATRGIFLAGSGRIPYFTADQAS